MGQSIPTEELIRSGAVFSRRANPGLAFTLIDNARVESLTTATPQAPDVQSIAVTGVNVQIDFAGAGSDTPAAFALQSSPDAESGYASDSGATITQVSQGQFRAPVAVSGETRFYRIQRCDASAQENRWGGVTARPRWLDC